MKAKEYIGKTFGKLTVIQEVQKTKSGVRFLCKCECGREKIVYQSNLSGGKSTTCGHCKDVCAGEKYGSLTLIKKEYRGDQAYWYCSCDCGNNKYIAERHIKDGKILSCGCYRARISAEVNTSHGFSKERLYGVWSDIKQRTENVNNPRYNDYGGRGISMCDSWKNDYSLFREWARQNGYNENANYGECTIDRINNDGNYQPNNCRWVSMKVQSNNRRPRRSKGS